MNKWVIGARIRTLPAAIAPVLSATALAYNKNNSINLVNGILSLFVGISLQIGVNYSNDYSDGIKGTDEERVGPTRLVASGLATPSAVKKAAQITYLIGAIFGLALTLRTNPLLILIGAIAIVAAWFYTGGKRPYGYKGLGEISVFIFFGLVATLGTYYTESGKLTLWALALAVEMGFLSCAILAVNNLRDLPKDALVGKHTLAVRLGDKRARHFLITLIIFPLLIQCAFIYITNLALLSLLVIPSVVKIIRTIRRGAVNAELIPALGAVAKLQSSLTLWIVIALVLGKP